MIPISLRGAYPKPLHGLRRRVIFIDSLLRVNSRRSLIKMPFQLRWKGFCDPGGIQTHDHLLRRQELYSAELPGRDKLLRRSIATARCLQQPAKIKKIPLRPKPLVLFTFGATKAGRRPAAKTTD